MHCETNTISHPCLCKFMQTLSGTSLSKWKSSSRFAFLGHSRSLPAFLFLTAGSPWLHFVQTNSHESFYSVLQKYTNTKCISSQANIHMESLKMKLLKKKKEWTDFRTVFSHILETPVHAVFCMSFCWLLNITALGFHRLYPCITVHYIYFVYHSTCVKKKIL